jgi:hypothetical protein
MTWLAEDEGVLSKNEWSPFGDEAEVPSLEVEPPLPFSKVHPMVASAGGALAHAAQAAVAHEIVAEVLMVLI